MFGGMHLETSLYIIITLYYHYVLSLRAINEATPSGCELLENASAKLGLLRVAEFFFAISSGFFLAGLLSVHTDQIENMTYRKPRHP